MKPSCTCTEQHLPHFLFSYLQSPSPAPLTTLCPLPINVQNPLPLGELDLRFALLSPCLAVSWINPISAANLGVYGASEPGSVTKGQESKELATGASLVAQWFRVCLPMQGTWVRALVWEDPTCHGATKPVSHNYWACASGACAPKRERPRQWEAHTPQWRVAPICRNWRKPSHRNEDPTQPKINKFI